MSKEKKEVKEGEEAEKEEPEPTKITYENAKVILKLTPDKKSKKAKDLGLVHIPITLIKKNKELGSTNISTLKFRLFYR